MSVMKTEGHFDEEDINFVKENGEEGMKSLAIDYSIKSGRLCLHMALLKASKKNHFKYKINKDFNNTLATHKETEGPLMFNSSVAYVNERTKQMENLVGNVAKELCKRKTDSTLSGKAGPVQLAGK